MRALLQTWNEKTLQEAINIWKHLKNNNKDFEDVENYFNQLRLEQQVKVKRKQFSTERHQSSESKRCPKCGLWMRVIDTKWICSPGCGACNGTGCGYTEPINFIEEKGA
jgi:hypothetical protein